jgi:hypothetical protein
MSLKSSHLAFNVRPLRAFVLAIPARVLIRELSTLEHLLIVAIPLHKRLLVIPTLVSMLSWQSQAVFASCHLCACMMGEESPSMVLDIYLPCHIPF